MAHNLAVCAWPLLLAAAGAGMSSRSSRFACGLVLAGVTVNVSLVGAAFGAYGTSLVPFVAQLPVE